MLGIDKMNMYREMLGLGQPTGIEISENIGVLDSPSYRTSINQEWMPGFTLQNAIGNGGSMFSPIQLVNETKEQLEQKENIDSFVYLSNDEFKLYRMIYYRALASLMKNATNIF